MSLDQYIQNWITIDNKMKQLNEQMKELKQKKETFTEHILSYAEQNNLSRLPDRTVKIVQTKTAQPLSFKYLEKCLKEIIKNESQVNQILNYIKQQREIKTEPEIKRFIMN